MATRSPERPCVICGLPTVNTSNDSYSYLISNPNEDEEEYDEEGLYYVCSSTCASRARKKMALAAAALGPVGGEMHNPADYCVKQGDTATAYRESAKLRNRNAAARNRALAAAGFKEDVTPKTWVMLDQEFARDAGSKASSKAAHRLAGEAVLSMNTGGVAQCVIATGLTFFGRPRVTVRVHLSRFASEKPATLARSEVESQVREAYVVREMLWRCFYQHLVKTHIKCMTEFAKGPTPHAALRALLSGATTTRPISILDKWRYPVNVRLQGETLLYCSNPVVERLHAAASLEMPDLLTPAGNEKDLACVLTNDVSDARSVYDSLSRETIVLAEAAKQIRAITGKELPNRAAEEAGKMFAAYAADGQQCALEVMQLKTKSASFDVIELKSGKVTRDEWNALCAGYGIANHGDAVTLARAIHAATGRPVWISDVGAFVFPASAVRAAFEKVGVLARSKGVERGGAAGMPCPPAPAFSTGRKTQPPALPPRPAAEEPPTAAAAPVPATPPPRQPTKPAAAPAAPALSAEQRLAQEKCERATDRVVPKDKRQSFPLDCPECSGDYADYQKMCAPPGDVYYRHEHESKGVSGKSVDFYTELGGHPAPKDPRARQAGKYASAEELKKAKRPLAGALASAIVQRRTALKEEEEEEADDDAWDDAACVGSQCVGDLCYSSCGVCHFSDK